jgi:hypothetical protein
LRLTRTGAGKLSATIVILFWYVSDTPPPTTM